MKRSRRKPVSKTELIAHLHRGLRPKLDRAQLVDTGLVHAATLDAIATGEATASVLRDYVANVLTWSKAAELLECGAPEMIEQLDLATRLVERFGRTGRVAFTGPDYQLAKDGLQVMDQLALLVDRPTAISAAGWSEARINEMAAKFTPLDVARDDERKAA